jgi:hypothetical protein
MRGHEVETWRVRKKNGAINMKSPQLDIFAGVIAATAPTAATHSLARSFIYGDETPLPRVRACVRAGSVVRKSRTEADAFLVAR